MLYGRQWGMTDPQSAFPVDVDRPHTPPAGQASRSLWIGSVGHNITAQDLLDSFSMYGAIESVRLLPEKECAFIK